MGRSRKENRCYCDYCEKKRQKIYDLFYNRINKDRKNAQKKIWKLNNPEKVKESNRESIKRCRDRVNKNSKNYRKLLKLRTPKWANIDKIKLIYKNKPKGYSVDHILPLRGKNVSGLHIETNLRYMVTIENIKKNNKY